ncbi:MAG: hypothetical protein ACYCVB_12160 [Bacilli bacterium]
MNRVHTNIKATGVRLAALAAAATCARLSRLLARASGVRLAVLAAAATVAAIGMPCGPVHADSLSGPPSSQPIAKVAMTLSKTAHPRSDLAVVENFLYTLQDLGAMVFPRVVLGSAYSQLSASMRSQVSLTAWTKRFAQIFHINTLQIIALPDHRFFVELEDWYLQRIGGAGGNNVQTVGYSDGVVSVQHGKISGFDPRPENTFAMLNRIQAWPYSLKAFDQVLVARQAAAPLQQNPLIDGIQTIAPYTYRLTTTVGARSYQTLMFEQADRSYTMLSIRPVDFSPQSFASWSPAALAAFNVKHHLALPFAGAGVVRKNPPVGRVPAAVRSGYRLPGGMTYRAADWHPIDDWSGQLSGKSFLLQLYRYNHGRRFLLAEAYGGRTVLALPLAHRTLLTNFTGRFAVFAVGPPSRRNLPVALDLTDGHMIRSQPLAFDMSNIYPGQSPYSWQNQYVGGLPILMYPR